MGAAPPRPGGSTGSGPARAGARRSGSSSSSTATCCSPSTSKNTPSTVATMPTRNRSWASVRRPATRPGGGAPSTPCVTSHAGDQDGVLPRVDRRRRRRAPTTGRTSSLRRRSDPIAAHLAVQAGEDLGREALDPVDDGRGPRVGAAGQALLVVGEGQDAQGEDLVDLGGVAHVAGALGGDRRVVVEDDRRRQHRGRVGPGRRSAPGRCPRWCRLDGRRGELGRLEQRDEPGVVACAAACARRRATGASPRRAARSGSHQSVRFSTVDPQLGERVRARGSAPTRRGTTASTGAALAHDPAGGAERLDVPAGRQA